MIHLIDIDYRDDDYKESGTAKAKNNDSGKMDPEDEHAGRAAEGPRPAEKDLVSWIRHRI